jgi:hypothetical protein
MRIEIPLVKLIRLQLSEQQQNCMSVLRNRKSDIELKEIEFNIEHLKSCPTRIKRIRKPPW